jgi:hypothetical protein
VAVPIQADKEVVPHPGILVRGAIHRQHVDAVNPHLEEADVRIGRPLRVHDEVVPVAAQQRREVERRAAGARRLVHEAHADVAAVGAALERRGAGLDLAVGVVVPLDDRARR